MATAIGGGGVEVSLATVITASRRIITVNSFDFKALTLISLLLPLFSLVSLSFLPSLLLLSSSPLEPPSFLDIGRDHVTLSAVIHVALFAAFLICFSQLCTASIIRSVLHEFYGRPLRVLPAVVSAISLSPWHLAGYAHSLTLPLVFPILCLPSHFLSFRLPSLVLGSPAPSPCAVLPTIAIFLALFFRDVYFELCLVLSPGVTVAGSTWRFRFPNPSRLLVSGVQLAALSFFLFLKLSAVLLLAAAAGVALFLCGEWARVVVLVVTCASLMAVFLCQAAAHTVLYMYSKAAHGDLAEVIAKKLISLPFDDHEVPPSVV